MTESADQQDPEANPAGPSGQEPGSQSPAPGPFFQRPDWLSLALTTIVAFAVYSWTLAPEVTLEFSGTLSTSAKYAGVAHPPGFPVWTLYSWLFANVLPVSNVAWRVAVGSAVAGALACGLVALVVSRAGSLLLESTPAFTRHTPADRNLLRVVCGFVAGMVFGLSSPVWRVAVIVETWTLSYLLLTLILCLLLRWMGAPEQRKFLYAAWLIYGLLLTSNQEFLLLLPALLVFVMAGDRALGRDVSLAALPLVLTVWLVDAFGVTGGLSGWLGAYLAGNVGLLGACFLVGAAAAVAVVRTRRVGSEWGSAVCCAVLFLLGFGACFFMPIASMTEPPVNWGYTRTVQGFIHEITRGQYERFYPTHELDRFALQLWFLMKETWKGFGWPYLVLLPLPVLFLGRSNRRTRAWLMGTMVMLVCVGPLMLELLNPSPERASFEITSSYWGGMDIVLAIWAGLGFMVLGSVLPSSRLQASPDTF